MHITLIFKGIGAKVGSINIKQKPPIYEVTFSPAVAAIIAAPRVRYPSITVSIVLQ
uniref:Uncharacterized protein n=1 Tax=uncultured bacterium contig00104 TaxID=1181571 RepID=A0A806KPV9_9BACT|nr:hypothetical protein [uncultured bacterium contig00104]